MDVLADIRGGTAAWDLLRRDPGAAGGRAVMLDIYRALPDAAAPHLAAICGRIAAGDVPLLIHCTAGKDRTGFVVAALLRIVGAEWEAVVADYLLSAGRVSDAVTAATRALVLEEVGFHLPDAALAALTGVERAYLEGAFVGIDAAPGGFDGYLEAAGIDADLRARVAGRLVV
jgi:protein-tyrosine phosphatase